MAGYNYGYNRSKMEQEFEKIAANCRAEGMPEDKIAAIHRIMLDELNSDRKFYIHTLSYDGLQFPDGDRAEDGASPLLKDYLEQFSVAQTEISAWGRFSWLDDIETPEIIVWLQSLGESDILLLTLLVVDGMRQTEAAKVLGKHGSAISRKLKQLRKSLEKVLPEWIKKQYIK